MTTSGPALTSRGVTVIVVESPVVVLCNFAGNGLAGTFLAGAFFARVGLTIFGERVATFFAGAAFFAGVAGAFFAGTVFTAFFAASFFSTGFLAGGAFLTVLLEAAIFCWESFLVVLLLETALLERAAFLAGAFLAVGVISIATSQSSVHNFFWLFFLLCYRELCT